MRKVTQNQNRITKNHQIKVNREMQTVPIGREVMMTGERHLTKVIDERILLTFYNAMFEETTHCTSRGLGKEYFLHCVTIWQISQLGSCRRGNLENALVSPISKGGHRSVLCSTQLSLVSCWSTLANMVVRVGLL